MVSSCVQREENRPLVPLLLHRESSPRESYSILYQLLFVLEFGLYWTSRTWLSIFSSRHLFKIMILQFHFDVFQDQPLSSAFSEISGHLSFEKIAKMVEAKICHPLCFADIHSSLSCAGFVVLLLVTLPYAIVLYTIVGKRNIAQASFSSIFSHRFYDFID